MADVSIEAWVENAVEEASAKGFRTFGLRFDTANERPKVGDVLPNSWHNGSECDFMTDEDTGESHNAELNGTCCFDLGYWGDGVESALKNAKSGGYTLNSFSMLLIAGTSRNIGVGLDGVEYGIPENGACCIPNAEVIAVWGGGDKVRPLHGQYAPPDVEKLSSTSTLPPMELKPAPNYLKVPVQKEPMLG